MPDFNFFKIKVSNIKKFVNETKKKKIKSNLLKKNKKLSVKRIKNINSSKSDTKVLTKKRNLAHKKVLKYKCKVCKNTFKNLKKHLVQCEDFEHKSLYEQIKSKHSKLSSKSKVNRKLKKVNVTKDKKEKQNKKSSKNINLTDGKKNVNVIKDTCSKNKDIAFDKNKNLTKKINSNVASETSAVSIRENCLKAKNKKKVDLKFYKQKLKSKKKKINLLKGFRKIKFSSSLFSPTKSLKKNEIFKSCDLGCALSSSSVHQVKKFKLDFSSINSYTPMYVIQTNPQTNEQTLMLVDPSQLVLASQSGATNDLPAHQAHPKSQMPNSHINLEDKTASNIKTIKSENVDETVIKFEIKEEEIFPETCEIPHKTLLESDSHDVETNVPLLDKSKTQLDVPSKDILDVKNTQKSNKYYSFQCKECYYCSNDQNKILSHLKDHFSRKMLVECNKCNFSSCDKDRVEQHVLVKHFFKCAECAFQSTSLEPMIPHTLSFHDNLIKCSFCNYMCRCYISMIFHKARHYPKTSFQCPECQHVTGDKWDFKVHISSHADNFFNNIITYNFAKRDKKRFFKSNISILICCSLCECKFSYEPAYELHALNHIYNNSDFQCGGCKNVRKEEGVANASHHKFLQVGVGPYRCISCNFKFYTQVDLYRHISTHSSSSYDCQSCNFTTTTEEIIRDHVKAHPYNLFLYCCMFCKHRFPLKDLLFNHMFNEHTNVKSMRKTEGFSRELAPEVPSTVTANLVMDSNIGKSKITEMFATVKEDLLVSPVGIPIVKANALTKLAEGFDTQENNITKPITSANLKSTISTTTNVNNRSIKLTSTTNKNTKSTESTDARVNRELINLASEIKNNNQSASTKLQTPSKSSVAPVNILKNSKSRSVRDVVNSNINISSNSFGNTKASALKSNTNSNSQKELHQPYSSLCDKIFTDGKELQNHKKKEADKDRLKRKTCSLCPFKACYQYQIDCHMLQHFKETPLSEAKNRNKEQSLKKQKKG